MIVRSLLLMLALMAATAHCTSGSDPTQGDASNDNQPNNAQQPITDNPNSNSLTSTSGSSGLIRIGPASYELDFTCVDRGAGEILGVGIGTDVNNKDVHSFVQAFQGEPYVGVEVRDENSTTLFEPRLGVPLGFTFELDILRFDQVDFVTGLNVETGEYTPAGIGSVVIQCGSYQTELPEDALILP